MAQVGVADITTGFGDANQVDVAGHVVAMGESLIVGILLEVASDASKEVLSIVWNPGGVAEGLTFYNAHSPAHGKLRAEVWQRASLTAGTETVRITIEGGNSQKQTIVCISATNVHQTTPLSDWETDEAVDSNGSVSPAQDADDLGFAFAGFLDTSTAFSPAGGETEHADFAGSAFRMWAASEDGAGAITLNWTQPSSKENVTVGFAIEAAVSVVDEIPIVVMAPPRPGGWR